MQTRSAVKDVLLFGGQGSRSLFCDRATCRLLEFLPGNTLAIQFLDSCRHAANVDLSLVAEDSQSVFQGSITDAFKQAEDLIKPSLEFQQNPIVQATTLYVHQILEYIIYASNPCNKTRENRTELSETAGFCSGILPALVVASFPNIESPEFLEHAIGAFRLAFWIAFRSAIFSHGIEDNSGLSSPWSLVLSGLSVEEAGALLADHNSRNEGHVIQISAIVSESTISLSGRGSDLQRFRDSLPASTISQPAYVHAYYHGGDRMRGVLEQIISDVQKRNIPSLTWGDVKLPVRSTIDGQYLQASASLTLLEMVLNIMLVHAVDWKRTSEYLVQTLARDVEMEHDTNFRVLAMGPNAGFLLPSSIRKGNYPRICVAEAPSEDSRGFLPPTDGIAIVGMSVDFPSGSGIQEFWTTLQDGINAASEVPSTRFNLSDYYDQNAGNKPTQRRMATKHGNFTRNPFQFDHSFFQISPREAKSMDPQQRILLQGALNALEDAGYAPDSTPSFQSRSTGVFVGVATCDYVDNLRNDIDVYYSPGTLRAFLSGRISYAFNWSGPSVVIDTACSSSAVAIHQACQALQNGDCTAALAGGVNVISSPDMYLGLSRAHFLSPTGQCKPFDASADGYCRSEGCGLFVLKRLSDAINEGDRIYGVIRGTMVNQSGNSRSITHPDAHTQAALFRDLLAKTRVPAESISVVEAHGTGTQAGDRTEIASLQDVFGKSCNRQYPMFLNSVKGNIGHAEAASGSAGLAKLLIMLQKGKIPPQASFKVLNPALSTIRDHKFIIPESLQPWNAPPGRPRRALLNNFGAAGSNVAFIVEECINTDPPKRDTIPRSSFLLNLSAKTSLSLEELRRSYISLLNDPKIKIDVESVTYSANARREHYEPYRISISGDSIESLAQKLQQATLSKNSGTLPNAIVFVFSGQGSQYPGMGAELLSTSPVYQDTVRECDFILRQQGAPGVSEYLGMQRKSSAVSGEDLDIIVSQCACFVFEYALARLWMSWGINPDIVIGHSIGEYAAFAISGALSLSDALLLVSRRAQLIASLCKSGKTGMTACNMSYQNVKTILTENSERFNGISVACRNSTTDCVVAGNLEVLKDFVSFCKILGCKVKQLDVPIGLHSEALNPMLEPFSALAKSVKMQRGSIPIGSSYLGRILDNEIPEADHFVNHARSIVKFTDVACCLTDFGRGKKLQVLEVGPGTGTLAMIKLTANLNDAAYLASLRRNEQPWETLTTSLRSLYLDRQPIQWRQVHKGSKGKFLDFIPRYPLSHSESLVPFRETPTTDTAKHIDEPEKSTPLFSLLREIPPTGLGPFQTQTSLLDNFIKAHVVGGTPLCPASVYIELAFEALHLRDLTSQETVYELRNLAFESPLVSSGGVDATVLVDLEFNSLEPTFSFFRVRSTENHSFCSGEASVLQAPLTKAIFQRKAALIKRGKDHILTSRCETLSPRMIYDVVFPRVVSYSAPFLTLKELHIDPSGLEGYGKFQIPISPKEERFICPLPLTDTLLHTAGFVANSKIHRDYACICVKVESLKALYNDISSIQNEDIEVYCSLVDCVEGYIIGDAFAIHKGVVIAAIEGMHFQMTRLRSFQAHLSRLAATPQIPKGGHHEAFALSTVSSTGSPTLVNSSPIPLDHDIRGELYEEISRISGADQQAVRSESRLADLGIDSLLFIELAIELQRKFSALDISKSELERCSTVLEIETVLLRLHEIQSEKSKPLGELEKRFLDPPVTALSTKEEIFRRDRPEKVSLSAIQDLVQKICGFSLTEVDKDITMASLGVDSLLSIELEHGLRQASDIRFSEGHGSISELTVRQFEKMILGNPNSTIPQEKGPELRHTGAENTVIAVQDGIESKCPLYLFHDGSGVGRTYSRVSALGRRVYAVSSLDFSNLDHSIETLEEYASRYISVIGLHNEPSVILGGWSFGGVLAFEIARQLQSLGKSVKGVILLDSPCPIKHEPLPDSIIEHITAGIQNQSTGMKEVRACIAAQFRRNARLLKHYNPIVSGQGLQCVMLKSRDTFDSEKLCGLRYPWLDDEDFRNQSINDWEILVEHPVPVLEVTGNHFDMFSNHNITSVSSQLKRACELLE